MLRRLRGKKGVFMVALFVAIVGIIIYTGFLVLTVESRPGRWWIGGVQGDIAGAYGEAEGRMFYVDKGVEYSALNAIVEVADKGGFGKRGSECGNFEGINLWFKDGEDCYPNAEESFILVFKEHFGSYLSGVFGNKLNTGDFEFVLDGDGTESKFKGVAKKRDVIEFKDGRYSYEPSFVMEVPYSFNKYRELTGKVGSLLNCLKNRKANSKEDITECNFDLDYEQSGDILVFNIGDGELSGKKIVIKFALDIENVEELGGKKKGGGLFE